MRSLGFTFLLALIAVLCCCLASWQSREENLHSVFGAPPTQVGQRLYRSFTANEVKHIRISANGVKAAFSLEENGWQGDTPWKDRMDPRSAVGIINFSLGMRVEDFSPADELDPSKCGLGESSIQIRLEDANHVPLANFKLGHRTPWQAEVEGIEQSVPTVFIQPRDKNRKRHIYACTGDINSLFNDGMKLLRDHRPFYFNPLTLRKIRIRSKQGDLTLGRAAPGQPWRIVKPLDLSTDPAAMKSLLEGVFELRATKLMERSAVTLPANDSAVKIGQIALVDTGSDQETLMEILPPDSADASGVKATVSDRPNTVFELPTKPEPGSVSLADLPLSVNELRDPTLTHLNIESLRGIAIRPSTGAEIVLTRDPPKPWMTTLEGTPGNANEENLRSLLKAVTTHRATGFESDAATDFTPWGLDKPFLTLRFLGQDNQALELRFGIDGKGGYFVNRLGTPTVMRVDQALVGAIAVRPYEWRFSRLWSLNRVNLIAIERKPATDTPLLLKYTFNPEGWTAERNGDDITASLAPEKANYLLGILEGLKVSRWLSPSDEAAATALTNPSLTITAMEKSVDDEDEFTAISTRTVTFAPAMAGNHAGYYYGRLNTETHPFLIDRNTYQKLAADLTEK